MPQPPVTKKGENHCIRWNDNHASFFSAAEKMCDDFKLTDVILFTGVVLFQAPKLVLSACS
jgi:hypothetical protein